jgi:surface protein
MGGLLQKHNNFYLIYKSHIKMSTTLKLKNSQTVIIPAKGVKLYSKPMGLTTIHIKDDDTAFTVPLNYYKNVIIDWGDESEIFHSGPGVWLNDSISHSYASGGPYNINIYVYDVPKKQDQESSKGRIPIFGTGNDYEGNVFIATADLGKLRCLEYSGSFSGASNLITVTGQIESSVRSLFDMFFGCTKLVSIPKWDVSRIINTNYMFVGCTHFNSPTLKDWDVSNVRSMDQMFFGCTLFNQDLSKWDVSNVIIMRQMFSLCINFNPSRGLARWNVSKVLEMSRMFQGCTVFNQDLSTWDITGIDGDYGDLVQFLDGTAFSTKNYNKLLKNWSSLKVQNNIQFGVPNAIPDPKYQKYQDHLVRVHKWMITGKP